jgi:hypothetical protein
LTALTIGVFWRDHPNSDWSRPKQEVAMYIRITRGHLDPTRYDELVSMNPDIRAAITALPGCQGVQNGGDRTSGNTLTVTTWDTEEHARVSRDTALGVIMSRLQAIGAQLNPPEIYASIP